jgi:hypothetical protein
MEFITQSKNKHRNFSLLKLKLYFFKTTKGIMIYLVFDLVGTYGS